MKRLAMSTAAAVISATGAFAQQPLNHGTTIDCVVSGLKEAFPSMEEPQVSFNQVFAAPETEPGQLDVIITDKNKGPLISNETTVKSGSPFEGEFYKITMTRNLDDSTEPPHVHTIFSNSSGKTNSQGIFGNVLTISGTSVKYEPSDEWTMVHNTLKKCLPEL